MLWQTTTIPEGGRSIVILAVDQAAATQVGQEYYGEGVPFDVKMLADNLYTHRDPPACFESPSSFARYAVCTGFGWNPGQFND